MPSVFFTDATGPCYHTVDDEIGVVDFDKLDEQVATAYATVRELARTATPPAFVPGTPLATYDDLVEASEVVDRAYADRARFSAADQDALTTIRDDAHRLVAEGRAAFGSDDVGVLLGHAARFIDILTHGTCSGFLDAQATARMSQIRRAMAAATLALEERARVAAQHLVDLLLRHAALEQRRDDVLDDVQEVPVRRHLLVAGRAGTSPEAVRVLRQDHLVGVAALAHRDHGAHAVLERQQDVEAEAVHAEQRARRRELLEVVEVGACRRSGRA